MRGAQYTSNENYFQNCAPLFAFKLLSLNYDKEANVYEARQEQCSSSGRNAANIAITSTFFMPYWKLINCITAPCSPFEPYQNTIDAIKLI